IQNQSLSFGLQVSPWNVERDVSLFREALEFGEQGAILRLSPRLNGALVEGLRFVRDHQVEIEVDGVAEALATRARAERVVERKQPRFGFLVAQVALLALEALGEAKALWLGVVP